MSDSEDLELEALQRQLDDAFETTRPRAGFEDELWTRMQAHRPARSRLRDAWVGLVQAIREAPTVPMAAVAAVLVVILGAGVFLYSGLGRGGEVLNVFLGHTPSETSSGDLGEIDLQLRRDHLDCGREAVLAGLEVRRRCSSSRRGRGCGLR